ncbi:DUF2975 domain-containing protein [Limnovirga soli]|nr:DUF2975 domain-containing protein [Limnovirga soli]
MIYFPTTEGRAEHLDLLSIYTDPFIMYAYLASIPFFVALYKAFRLLGYIGDNKIFSPSALMVLRSIQYCAIVQCILIVIAGIYSRIFHDKEDDPAGFMALCMIGSFIAITVAIVAAVFGKIVQQGIYLMEENEQLKSR